MGGLACQCMSLLLSAFAQPFFSSVVVVSSAAIPRRRGQCTPEHRARAGVACRLVNVPPSVGGKTAGVAHGDCRGARRVAKFWWPLTPPPPAIQRSLSGL